MAHGYKKIDLSSYKKNNNENEKETFQSSQKNEENILDTYHINPYNFVPLGKNCIRAPYSKGDLTGKIHCTLVPKSDVFIPNTSNESCEWNGREDRNNDTAYDDNGIYKHKAKEFFSYKNLNENENLDKSEPEKPVIPGSEIRGMVRNMYEAFTDSCLSAFEEDKELSSRTSIPNKPGILKYSSEEGWKLYKAEPYRLKLAGENGKSVGDSEKNNIVLFEKRNHKIKGTDGKEYDTFSYVRFDIKEYTKFDYKTKKTKKSRYVSSLGETGAKSGYLLLGEAFINKKCDNIFCETDSVVYPAKNCTDTDKRINAEKELEKAIENYNKIIEYYNDPKINKAAKKSKFDNDPKINKAAKKSEFYNDSKIKSKERIYPVWYNIVNNRVYLSPSCIGRYIYQNKLKDFINNYQPCVSEKEVCEACALFGFISDRKADNVLASAVRFSDAVFSGSKPEYSPITTIKELSGPKITSMDMYTHLSENKTGDFWTYDFFIKDNNYIKLQKGDILLNGRKFYYHSRDDYKAKPDKNGKTQTERNLTIRPLKGCNNNTFQFDVFFEHISEEQLKKLLIVLSLRGNESEYEYKLGLGKPIGLGSVKIKVDDVKIRTIDSQSFTYSYKTESKYVRYYTEDMTEECFNLSEDSEILQALNSITSSKYVNSAESVSYPVGYDKTRKPGEGYQWFMNNRGTVNKPQFDQFLFEHKDGKLYDNVDRKALKKNYGGR